jgi:hypothetical protein
MNSVVFAFLLVNVLALSHFATADSAASCYVCNSATDAGCADPFGNKAEYEKACENGETFCRKTVQSGKLSSIYVGFFCWLIE